MGSCRITSISRLQHQQEWQRPPPRPLPKARPSSAIEDGFWGTPLALEPSDRLASVVAEKWDAERNHSAFRVHLSVRIWDTTARPTSAELQFQRSLPTSATPDSGKDTFAAMFFFEASLLVVMLSAIALGVTRPDGGVAWPFPPPRQSKRRGGRRELLHPQYFGRDETCPSFVAYDEVGCGCPASLDAAVAAVLLLCWGLPFLAGSGAVLHQDRLRDHWRLIYGNSLCSSGCGVETSLAQQAPNDGRLRTRRDNSGAP